jgi:hypothetical protein
MIKVHIKARWRTVKIFSVQLSAEASGKDSQCGWCLIKILWFKIRFNFDRKC